MNTHTSAAPFPAWNDTDTGYPGEVLVEDLFLPQVEKNPDRIALLSDERSLTYQALNESANRLAHHLRGRGIGPEALVGLLAKNSIEAVVGILGILKAGGAYVPLDPDYPGERLSLILADTKPSLLLVTQERFLSALPEHSAPLICLEREWPRIEREPSCNLARQGDPGQLAYIIYTSGSSGRPKGVMVEHRSLCNLAEAEREVFGIHRESRVLQFASLCFDVSVFEIFSTLFAGATLCIASPTSLRSGPALLAQIRAQKISVACLPPSLLAALPEDNLPSLTTIITGGEPCSAQTVARWSRGRRFFNAYGPTEATVGTTIAELTEASDPLCIGRPLANTRLYLLDDALTPVPLGATGEIYIGGVGVARGYLGCPDLTRERFLPDPFSRKPSARMYKTGDLARFSPEGDLLFVGRLDQQVKVRGFRVELGEIEAALARHPEIREVAVLLREDAPQDKRLVAYSVPRSEKAPPSPDALRGFLQNILPGYMIPSAFVSLSSFPLTPNGKIDRKALPAPPPPAPARSTAPPQTPGEKKLAALFSEILGRGTVGRHDDFFALGGDSLLATRLLLRLEDAWGTRLSPEVFWQAPTVADLGRLLDETEHARGRRPAAPERALEEEVSLAEEIAPGTPVRIGAQVESALLTGATGFLGSFLLRALLRGTSARIYCLVRAASREEAHTRLRSAFQRFTGETHLPEERITPLVGDLSLPRFGWEEAAFQALADEIAIIYHSGAQVDMLRPYTALRPVNVLGTREILRFACLGRAKPVHYVSTIGVFPAAEEREEGCFGEDDRLTKPRALLDGYTQSKWVSEKLLEVARGRGLPVAIYRPATISGCSRTGVCNTADFFCRMLKGCIALGCAPEEGFWWNLAPVDYVSEAIFYLSLHQAEGVFHLVNPEMLSMSGLVHLLNTMGYSLAVVSYQEWWDRLRRATEGSREGALSPLVLSLRRSSPAPLPRFDARRAAAGLEGSSLVCPPSDGPLFARYLAYLTRSGFLP